MLHIVSTPIGNIGDVTYRAIELLKQVDYILVEDTRRTSKLLNHYNIKNKLITYNDINKKRKTPSILQDLKIEKEVALVSDSGTPGVSDPGFYLVRECVNYNIKVSPVPGPNALISALVCSGLPTDKFTFYGFFPKKQGKIKSLLNEIKKKKESTVFYESPHRILKTLKQLSESLPEHNMVIARELTKKFEEFIRGTVKEVYNNLKDKSIKGEITVIISSKY